MTKIHKLLPAALISVSNWLFPHRCLTCATAISGDRLPVCDPCYSELPFQQHCCDQCGQLLNTQQDYCGRCIKSPPPFDLCFCPFRYESPISDHIQQLKYAEQVELAKPLAKLLATEILDNDLPLPEILLPVPIHLKRLRRRGFNQSLEICKHLSRELNIPYTNQLIEKTRDTPAQAGLRRKDRRAIVRNSFRLKENFTKKSVAIIDDVFTTGSTAAEIAKILKRNGVDYVYIWGLAHTI